MKTAFMKTGYNRLYKNEFYEQGIQKQIMREFGFIETAN